MKWVLAILLITFGFSFAGLLVYEGHWIIGTVFVSVMLLCMRIEG